MSSMGHRIRRATLFFGGLLAATLVFELYLRVVEATPLWHILPAAEASFYGPDPDTGYAIRPGVEGLWLTENHARVRMSSQGLRDHDTSYAKPSATFRIALAGDSITEALQVDLDKTFAVLLEQRLGMPDRPVEVVNLGISGAVPTVQLARMESLGRRFHPDLMVYIINFFDFASSIVGEDQGFPGYAAGRDGVYRLSYRFREGPQYRFRISLAGQAYYWMLDHFRVARVLNSRRNQGLGFSPVAAPAAPSSPSCNPERGPALLSALKGAPEGAKMRGIFFAYLRDVAATAKTEGVPAVLALRGLSPGCPSETAKSDELKRLIGAALAERGIGMLDMDSEIHTALVRDAKGKSKRDLYGFGARLGDGHLNDFGHRIFASALETGLKPWVQPHH